MRLRTLGALLCSLVLLSACKKDKTDDLETAKQNLTSHRWKISSTVMVTASGEQNQTIQSCRIDDLWEYKADGSFALYPGSSLCTSGQTTIYGTWQLLDGGKSLKVTLPSGSSYTDEVKELTSTKLRTSYTTSNVYIDTFVSN